MEAIVSMPRPRELARLLVTSSRGYRDRATVFRVLENFLITYGSILVVHGHCKSGGDAIANEWAEYHKSPLIDVEPHPVEPEDWVSQGLGAGLERNRNMVFRGAVECAAFLAPCTSIRCRRTDPHAGHGSSGCVRLAERSMIPTTIYWQDDVVLAL